METTGVVAWTIEVAMASNWIVSTGYMPGAASNQSAYCSKLFRLWGILQTVQKFLIDMSITKGAMTITCDGLSVLKQAQYQQITDLNIVHYDMISTI